LKFYTEGGIKQTKNIKKILLVQSGQGNFFLRAAMIDKNCVKTTATDIGAFADTVLSLFLAKVLRF
jgi:hypothetical protein